MSHRFPRLRFFQHNPSGPHSVAGVIDHVLITGTDGGFTQIAVSVTVSSTVTGYVGNQTQLTATAYDSRGIVIANPAVSWSSGDGSIATVSPTGVVTLRRIGSTSIFATVDGRSYSTTATCVVQDGSNADVLAGLGAHILSFWDVATNLTLGAGGTSGGVAQIDDVRGIGSGPSLFGVQDAAGTFWLPNYDSTTKSARTNTGGITTLVTAWAGSTTYDMSQVRTIVMFGTPVTVGVNVYFMGAQLGSDSTIAAHLQANAQNPQTVDALLDTAAGKSYNWQSKLPLGTTPRLIIFTVPQPTGANHSLQATPMATVESPGRARRMLLQNSPNDNDFTRFSTGAYRIFFGGNPHGTNSVDTADVIFYGGLVIDKVLSRSDIAALERWAVRRGITPDAAITKLIDCVGDSRTFGNGSVNFLTDPWPIKMQTLFAANYDVVNRGVSGDGFLNAVDANVLGPRVGFDQDAYRSGGDWCVIWEGVNSFNSGMSAATALVNLDTMIATAKADGKKVCICHETTQAGGMPAQPAFNAGIDARLASGAINAVAALDSDSRLMDPFNVTYFTDGLHYTPAGYAIIAQIVHDAIVAAGG